ncbi:putative carbamoyl-phosphate synthase, large chain [Candidatus Nitrososphaera gargensis Ga9.2]|uniref:Putative carbamoyl-phosphate synthase, large chain n=1 Tax=Nitrososphaera gargensis (strain Ga9.2) TaxID=1237085 RepID=K0IAR9_NITGG|nr:ATP-grasp domain-containing protein [Candidatus Nitrososphaera gargensis]AFU58431.1 putative carbamoyl-phosphate synthase, large chain [Candidatus Nitrososphaera gargensis Ga9.2]
MIANVLVTSAGGIVGQGIIKALKLSNKSAATSPVTYNIFGTDMNPLATGLYRCNTGMLVPPATSPDYIDFIIGVCKNNNISAIFVGSDGELLTLAAAREKIERESGAKVLSGPSDILSIARDKWKTYEFCKANNIPFADSALPPDSEQFVREFGFPVVVKPREGYGSVHFNIVHNRMQMEQVISEIEAAGWRPIIQRYLGHDIKHNLDGIDGANEFTTGITVDKTGKRVMSSISIKKILKAGQTHKALIDDFPGIRKPAEAVALKLNAAGPINVQAKLEGDTPVVFEINPRLSATCAMRAFAGVNEPDIIYRNFLRDEEIKVDSYQKLVCLRYLNEVYVPFSVYSRVLVDKEISNSERGSFIPDYF